MSAESVSTTRGIGIKRKKVHCDGMFVGLITGRAAGYPLGTFQSWSAKKSYHVQEKRVRLKTLNQRRKG